MTTQISNCFSARSSNMTLTYTLCFALLR